MADDKPTSTESPEIFKEFEFEIVTPPHKPQGKFAYAVYGRPGRGKDVHLILDYATNPYTEAEALKMAEDAFNYHVARGTKVY